MTDLSDAAATWEGGVYQIETTDPVVGGAPNPGTGAGMSNIPHLQLARRTVWLKAQFDALAAELAAIGIDGIAGLTDALNAKAPLAGPAFTGNPTVPTQVQFNDSTRIASTAFVQRALGNYAGGTAATGSGTLTAVDVGKCYVFTGASAATITLPAIASVAFGGAVTIHNTGTAALTVDGNGSEQIDRGAGSAASITIKPGNSATLVRVQFSTVWHLAGPSAAWDASADLSESGYQRLPSGLILQWTTCSVPAFGSYIWTYPMVFPSACLNVSATPREGGNALFTQGTPSTTTCQIDDSGGGGTLAYLIAIGH